MPSSPQLPAPLRDAGIASRSGFNHFAIREPPRSKLSAMINTFRLGDDEACVDIGNAGEVDEVSNDSAAGES